MSSCEDSSIPPCTRYDYGHNGTSRRGYLLPLLLPHDRVPASSQRSTPSGPSRSGDGAAGTYSSSSVSTSTSDHPLLSHFVGENNDGERDDHARCTTLSPPRPGTKESAAGGSALLEHDGHNDAGGFLGAPTSRSIHRRSYHHPGSVVVNPDHVGGRTMTRKRPQAGRDRDQTALPSSPARPLKRNKITTSTRSCFLGKSPGPVGWKEEHSPYSSSSAAAVDDGGNPSMELCGRRGATTGEKDERRSILLLESTTNDDNEESTGRESTPSVLAEEDETSSRANETIGAPVRNRKFDLMSFYCEDDDSSEINKAFEQGINHSYFMEGMHIYDSPAPITFCLDQIGRDESCSLLVMSLICYNCGLTHSKHSQFYAAAKCFEDSLARLEETEDFRGRDYCFVTPSPLPHIAKRTPLVVLSKTPTIAQQEGTGPLLANWSSGNMCMALEIMVHHNLGHCYYRLRQMALAMEHYEHALSAIQLNTDLPEKHAAAAMHCVGVIRCHVEEPTEALPMLQESLAWFERKCGFVSNEVAIIQNSIGSAHYLSGDFASALAVYTVSKAIREIAFGTGSFQYASVTFNIGMTYHRLGCLDAALSTYTEFLGIAEEIDSSTERPGSFVSDTRDVAIAYTRMGEIMSSRNKLDDSILFFETGLAKTRVAFGRESPEVASILNRLGNLYCEKGGFGTALRYYHEGLAMEEALWGPNHPHIIITLANIAHIFKHIGKFEVALEKFRAVLGLETEALGPNHIELAETYTNIGLMHYRLNRYAPAFDSYQEALRIQHEHFQGKQNLDLASTLNSLGLVAFKLGMSSLAKSCIAHGLRIVKSLMGADSRDVAILWYNIATVSFDTGEPDHLGFRYYREALRIERQILGDDHPDIVLTLVQIGQKCNGTGNIDGALSCFKEALEVERRRGRRHSSAPCNLLTEAKILNLIGNIQLQRGEVADLMLSYAAASRIFERLPESSTDRLAISGYFFYGVSKMFPPCAAMA